MKRVVNGNIAFTCLRLPGILAAYADLASLEVYVLSLEVLQLSFTYSSIQKSEVDRI